MVVGEPPAPSTSGGGQDNKEFYLQVRKAYTALARGWFAWEHASRQPRAPTRWDMSCACV